MVISWRVMLTLRTGAAAPDFGGLDRQLNRCTGFAADAIGGLFGCHAESGCAVDGDDFVIGTDADCFGWSCFDGACDDKVLLIFALHQVDADAYDASVDGVVFILEGARIEVASVGIVESLEHDLQIFLSVSIGVNLTVVLVLVLGPVFAVEAAVVKIVMH